MGLSRNNTRARKISERKSGESFFLEIRVVRKWAREARRKLMMVVWWYGGMVVVVMVVMMMEQGWNLDGIHDEASKCKTS